MTSPASNATPSFPYPSPYPSPYHSPSPSPLSSNRHLLVLLFYFLLAILMTWPLATAPHRMILGSEGDSLFFVWNLWWTQKAIIQQHHLPFLSDIIYRPFSVPLMHHTHTYFYGLVYCAGSFLYRNPIFWLNACIFSSFTLAGYGTFLLARRATGSAAGALVAGVAFAFCSSRLMRSLGHINLLSNEGIPFFLYFMIRGFEEARPRHLAAAGAVAAATLWNDYYNALFIALLALFYLPLGLRTWRERGFGAAQLGRSLGAGSAAFLFFAAPFLYGLWRTVRTMDLVVYKGAEEFSASALAYLIPSGYHRFMGEWTRPLYGYAFPGNVTEACVYVGILTLTLAIYGLVRAPRGDRLQKFLLISGLMFAVLSLGPSLHLDLGGTKWTLAMPYRLVIALPMLADFRIPARLGTMAVLCAALLSAWGFREIALRLANRSARAILFIACVLLVLAEHLHAPWPFHYDGQDPAIIPRELCRAIADDPGPGAVLSIPFQPQDFRGAWMQTFHNKPTVGGVHARLGEDRRKYYGRLDLDGWFAPDTFADGKPNPWSKEAIRQFCYLMDLQYLLLPAWGGEKFRPDKARRDWLPLASEKAEGEAWLGVLERQALELPIKIDSGSLAANCYFLENFEAPESGSRWARGDHSTVVFKIDAPEDMNLSILFGYPTHLEKGRQSLKIELNRAPLAGFALEKEWETRELPLPKARLRAGWNYIKLIPSLAISPSELGQGKDRRPLSLLVGPIEIRRPEK